MSTPDERATWKALAEEATSGPWERSAVYRVNVIAPSGQIVCRAPARDTNAVAESLNAANAAFVMAARTAVPALLADVERLERELARHRQCGLMPAEEDL